MTPRLLTFAEIVEPLWTGYRWLYALACIWIGTSILLTLWWSRGARVMKGRARPPEPAPEVVNWLPLLPPVPAPSRHFTDDLDDQPADCLSDDEITRRFDRLVAGL